jgi:hypothetical protein
MAQRAELEHKFNDINEVRTQINKLKEEIFIARHVKMSQYVNDRKGAQMLMARDSKTNGLAKPASQYDLNVEVGSDGSVKIIPPMSATNSPAH